ncbi:hypothetical protein OH77DRAFT_1040392 [Trametes cingulata]|nr:hypothetical protein OH77DRAFT_1040392 [Trametes cingulata]
MDGKIMVIPYKEMLERFVPAPEEEEEPVSRYAELNFKPVATTPEAAMYGPLMEILNSEWLTNGFVARATPHKGDSNAESAEKIDGGLYPPGAASASDDQTDWSTIELSIECKTKKVQHDPVGKTDNHQPKAHSRRHVLGQIMSYAVLVFDNQHRTHHFTLIIFEEMARIVRWDRSGAIFSEHFNYVNNPAMLARFLWRFTRLSAAQRGHDPTAIRVLPGTTDYDLILRRRRDPYMVGEHKIGEHARLEFEKSTKDPRSLWSLEVGDTQKPRRFLVGKPHFLADGLAGRGTRGYVAIDLEDCDGPLVYLKDAWRVAHPRMRKEGDILSYLADSTHGDGVSNIPTLVCHGDVGEQVTESQKVWKDAHPKAAEEDCPMKTHRHYRLVVKEVGLPISAFINGRELVYLILTCIMAHFEAYQKGILHRDISSGNVLIHVQEYVGIDGKLSTAREGLLTDWELSKHIEDAEEGPRQPGRTGTWQFLSANALSDRHKQIVVQDEMESFFHLLLYLAIRYLPHNCTDVGDFMHRYFDGFLQDREDQEYTCGETKYTAMTKGELTVKHDKLLFLRRELSQRPSHQSTSTSVEGTSSQPGDDLPCLHPINSLFDTLLTWLKAHYTLCREQQKPSTRVAPAEPDPLPDADGAAIVEESNANIDRFLAGRLRRGVLKRTGGQDAAPMHPGTPTASAISEEDRKKREELAERTREEFRRLAAKLGSHEEVLLLFSEHLEQKGNRDWPSMDKTKDQLPEDYRPKDEREIGCKRSYFDSYASETGELVHGAKKGRSATGTSRGIPAVP